MDPHTPHKLFATKYCFLIPGDDTSFFFFLSFFFGFLLFYVVISFYKFILLLLLLLLFFFFFFFMKIIFYFFMFKNVPECSVFRVLSTPAPSTCIRKFLHQDFFFGRIRLPSTHIRWIRHTKPQLFQSSLQRSPEWIFNNYSTRARWIWDER